MRACRPKRSNISKTFGLLIRPLRGHLPLKGKALMGACDSPLHQGYGSFIIYENAPDRSYSVRGMFMIPYP